MGKLYDTDMSEAAWALVAPLLPPAKPGGRPRTTCMQAVLNAVFYLLRSGCQWRPALPPEQLAQQALGRMLVAPPASMFRRPPHGQVRPTSSCRRLSSSSP